LIENDFTRKNNNKRIKPVVGETPSTSMQLGGDSSESLSRQVRVSVKAVACAVSTTPSTNAILFGDRDHFRTQSQNTQLFGLASDLFCVFSAPFILSLSHSHVDRFGHRDVMRIIQKNTRNICLKIVHRIK
jgi:hypothetical protein